ncbi:MAG: SDR family oxidoreductase [Chloroflexi bacterium]|nr:MAG: SDR family oxidoreductase [Chloroflexota bacterium]
MTQRVFITGANRGIGLEFVRQLLARGDRVFATARRPQQADALQHLVTTYPQQLSILKLDVADNDAIEAAYQAVQAETNALDLLINNAGIIGMSDDRSQQAFGNLNFEDTLYVLRVNAVGPLMIAQRFVELLKAGNSPRLVNITSQLGSLSRKTSGGRYHYDGSKAALNMFTRTLAFDLLPHGIVTIMIHPGWVQTDMGGDSANLTPQAAVKSMLHLFDNLTKDSAGRFYKWDGSEHAW